MHVQSSRTFGMPCRSLKYDTLRFYVCPGVHPYNAETPGKRLQNHFLYQLSFTMYAITAACLACGGRTTVSQSRAFLSSPDLSVWMN